MANLIALGGRAVDENLAVVTNATAYFYLVGSTTPLVVYSDNTLTTALGSSVAGDAEGVFPQCWTSLSKVKVDVRDASGVSLPGFPQDNFPTFPEGGQSADQITTNPVTGNAGTDAQTFMANNVARLNTRDNGAALVTSSGVGGAYAITAQYTITAYAALQEYEFVANHDSVGASDTLNVDGQGAIGLRKYDATGSKVVLAAEDISQGDVVRVKYDGTHFVLVGSTKQVTLLDEDDFASNSDTAGTTQQAAKAYIDGRVDGTAPAAVATTSGQTINLATGLSGVRAFSVFFQNVSLSGATDSVLVQLGTSGGFVTSGYVSESSFGTAVSSDTNGFLSRLLGSSRELIGEMRFTHMGGNLWRASHVTNYGIGGGYITLAGELTQIRLQVSGTPTDSFDNGSAQAFIET